MEHETLSSHHPVPDRYFISHFKKKISGDPQINVSRVHLLVEYGEKHSGSCSDYGRPIISHEATNRDIPLVFHLRISTGYLHGGFIS